MFGRRDQGSATGGVVRDAESPLITDLFKWKSARIENDGRCIVGFALTHCIEVIGDEFIYGIQRDAETYSHQGVWKPATRPREMECRGVLARSTPEEFLPVLVTVQEDSVGVPEAQGKEQPALGELHLNSKVVGKHYFIDVRLCGSRSDLIEKFKAAFRSASLSSRSYVELRCEIIPPDVESFRRELNADGYTNHLPITQIWLEDELSLPLAAAWTWNWENR